MTKTKGIFEAEETTLSEEEDSTLLEDDDICSAFELNQSFQVGFKIADESAATLKKDYVLSLCQDNSFTHIAAGLSNGSVQLFDISNERGLSHSCISCIPAPLVTDAANPANICGVRFLNESSNSLLIGSTNGLVRLFDLRTPQQEQARFADTSDSERGVGSSKNITCFDRNANGRILCAGTDQYRSNVYLLFYDVRERKQLGGYFESHQDDVTAVRFHERNPDLLCSGSTDGLINVFDIKAENEDDALLTTINTESSVHKLNWHKNVYDKDIISCITHTNQFKVYECEEGDVVAEFEREKITTAMKRKNAANCNVIDAHNTENDGVFLLAGTNFKKGEIMRSLSLLNKQLLPLANFEGNKQIVRESLYDPKSNCLITAGECGIVSLWSPQSTTTTATSRKLKSKSESKSYKKTPY